MNERKIIEAIEFVSLAINHLTIKIADVTGLDTAYHVTTLLSRADDLLSDVKKELSKF